MQIALAAIKPNPFRDFELYPIEDEQVQRLLQSINELGFFAGVTARPQGNGFELAMGHHRLKAAKEAGLKEVEATIKPYTDWQMVQIMTMENLTQRGHNAASALDSVAAYAKIVSREVLLGEGASSKILEEETGKLAKAQTTIASDGPGMPLLYRAINGFDKKARKENKEAEIITETDISNMVKALKESGRMAVIVADAHEWVEATRAEREAADQVAKEEAAKPKERQRRKKQRIAVHNQRDHTPENYDIRCVNVFRLVSHDTAFRTVVLSDNGQKFIPVTKQLALAKLVRKQIDDIERKRDHDLGSTTIRSLVREHLNEAIRVDKDIKAKERKRLLLESQRERVNSRWATVRRGLAQATAAMLNIANEQKKWPMGVPFPIDMEAIDRGIDLGDRFRLMKGIKGEVNGKNHNATAARPAITG